MVNVCFVCLGNICRSPTAEGVMRHWVQMERLEGMISVDSAGTAAYHAGEPPDPRARRAARRRGIQVEGRARRFGSADWSRFDYVLPMDQSNLEDLLRIAPSKVARAKVRLFRSFDPAASPGATVPDPYYGGAEGFDEVLDMCESAARGLIVHLRREHGL